MRKNSRFISDLAVESGQDLPEKVRLPPCKEPRVLLMGPDGVLVYDTQCPASTALPPDSLNAALAWVPFLALKHPACPLRDGRPIIFTRATWSCGPQCHSLANTGHKPTVSIPLCHWCLQTLARFLHFAQRSISQGRNQYPETGHDVWSCVYTQRED